MSDAALENACREAWTAEGLSDKTIHAYLLVLRRADAALRELGTTVLEASAREIRELSAAWPRTRSSRQQLRVALSRAWSVAERLQAPTGAVRVPSKPRYRCRALAEASAAVLARVARADEGPAGLAVLIGLYAGLRREEIARLRWSEIRDGWLEFIGKLDVSRQVPIHPELALRLEAARAAQLAAGVDSPYVFPGRLSPHVTPTTVWTWSRRLGLEALGAPVPTHVLRHTAIATLNDVTHDLRAAQAFAGHASPETTVLYTRVTRERLVDAVAAIRYVEEGA